MFGNKSARLKKLSKKLASYDDNKRAELVCDYYSQPELVHDLLTEIASTTANIEEFWDARQFLSAILASNSILADDIESGEQFHSDLEETLQNVALEGKLTYSGCYCCFEIWIDAQLSPPEIVFNGLQVVVESNLEQSGNNLSDFYSLYYPIINVVESYEDLEYSTIRPAALLLFSVIPEQFRRKYVESLVIELDIEFLDFGCSLLLTQDQQVRNGAMDALIQFQEENKFPSYHIALLKIIENWIVDADVKERVHKLISQANYDGENIKKNSSEPEFDRIIATEFDSTGTQSLLFYIKFEEEIGMLLLVLISRGTGIKDLIFESCEDDEEYEQKVSVFKQGFSASYKYDVPYEYARNALGIALADGLANGYPPHPGLVDFIQASSIDELNPLSAKACDIVSMCQSKKKLDKMSKAEKERLIASSKDWLEIHKIVEYWFLEDDEVFDELSGESETRDDESYLWKKIEESREHWAAIIANTALLFDAIGDKSALEFLAVADSMLSGRNLKEIPIMKLIFDQTFEVVAEEQYWDESNLPPE